jgi:hypothetical protein
MNMVAETKAGKLIDMPQSWGFRDELVPALIDKVRALRPLLRSNAQAGENQRSPTEAAVRAIGELNLWWMIVPRRWGGLGLSATAMARINAEIAKGDPSVAWVSQILNGTTWIGTLGSDALQQELFGKGLPQICSAVTPPGTAVPVAGGYRVNGKWPYSSGSRQATWSMMGVMRVNADGSRTPGCLAYMPMSQVTIEDTWYSVGMQGTGSDTIVAKDVFVPEHQFVPIEKNFSLLDTGKRHFGEPSDYFPLITLVRSTSCTVRRKRCWRSCSRAPRRAASSPPATPARPIRRCSCSMWVLPQPRSARPASSSKALRRPSTTRRCSVASWPRPSARSSRRTARSPTS